MASWRWAPAPTVAVLKLPAPQAETGRWHVQAAVTSEPVRLAQVPPRVNSEAATGCVGLGSVLALQ
jgi:hypothetical protein